MKRYSTLYGAFTFVGADGKKKNQYQALGRSEGLAQFLKELKVTDVNKAINDTARFLSGFQALPGYNSQPAGDKPMLIRYVPMYLGRRPDWNSDVGSYCAISGSSPDNMVGNRDGKYYHTYFMDKEMLLRAAEGYNYLDHIFGTHLMTWQENQARDQGKLAVNYDKLPSKVVPVLRPMDEQVVKAVTAALLTKASDGLKPMKVVLKLENDCVFNRRAMELLTQIYSLLPPAMATEIGFAAYQHPDKVRELYQETRIRLFLTVTGRDSGDGAEQNLDADKISQQIRDLAAEDVWVLDLNQDAEAQIAAFEAGKKMKALHTAISYWYAMAWETRVQVMEQLFVRVSDPQDGRLYTEVTKAYAQDPFWEWCKTMPDRGTVDSLAGLKEIYDRFPICDRLPYAHEQFAKVARRTLKEKGILPRLVGEMATRISMADDANAAEVLEQKKLYEFGKALLSKDITLAVASAVKKENTEKVTEQVRAESAAEIAGLKKEKKEAAAAHSAAMAAKDEAHKTEITGLNTAHAAALVAKDQEKAAAVEAEQAKTAAVQAKLDDADRVHGEAVTKLNADHAQAMTDAAAAHKEETDKLTGLLGSAWEAIEGLKGDVANRDQTITGLKADAAAKDQTIAGLKADAAAKDQTIAGQKADLAKAAEAYTAQGEELNKARAAATRRKQKNTEYEAEIGRLNDLLIGKGIDPTPKKPKEPTMNLLGVEMPKSAMKVIAIFAAAALVIGALVSGIIVGAVAGGKEETPTVPTTTAPVETTTAPTTAPTEPSVPETTAPPETTVPPTEPPVVTALGEDGSADWAFVQEKVTFIESVQTEPEAMAEMLDTWGVDHSRWNVEAVITVAGEADQDAGQEVPPFVVVLKADEEARTENTNEEETTDYATNDLVVISDAILAVGDRALLCSFPYGEEHATDRNAAVNAMLETAWLILAEDAQLEMFRYNQEEGGRTVDLTDLQAEKDWRDVYGIHFDAEKMENYQFILGTARTPVSVVYDLSDIVVFDYSDDSEKAQELSDNMNEKGHTALVQNDFVLVQINDEAVSTDENA